MNLCKRFVGKGAACSLEACERVLFAIRGGSERNHFSCSRGVNRSGFISCSKKFSCSFDFVNHCFPPHLLAPLRSLCLLGYDGFSGLHFYGPPHGCAKKKASLSELEPAINLAQFVERCGSAGSDRHPATLELSSSRP